MKPEDITGIDSKGFRVHVDGCTCDYNELTRRAWVRGEHGMELSITTDRPVFRVNPACKIHNAR